MVSVGVYNTWLANQSRDEFRVMLVEIDYADKDVIVGHGRSNFAETLNEVTALQAQTYLNNAVDITFTQPTSQEGYSWEVWMNGSVVSTTQGGSYNFTATNGQQYKFAVASVKGDAYSKPWTVTFTANSTASTYPGAVGDWNDVGNGTGTTGTGTIYLSSYPWMSDTFISYDDHITLEPEIETNLKNFGGIGDFRATNQFPQELEWKNQYWHGHRCNFFHGDVTWPREDFWLAGSAIVDDCRMIDSLEYQFDLVDGAASIQRNYGQPEVTLNTSVFQALNHIKDAAGLPTISYASIPAARRNYSIEIKLDEETNIGDAIRSITNSINVYMRVNIDGTIDIFNKDETTLDNRSYKRTLDESEIVDGDVRMAASIKPARRVVLEMPNNNSVKGTTSASTGSLSETVTIKTLLTDTSEANAILAEYVEYYSVPHAVWDIGVIDYGGRFRIADLVEVDHPMVSGKGVVTMVKNNWLSNYYKVEIEI